MIKKFLFPFGRRKPHEGPHYADMYERTMAMMIDMLPLMILFGGVSYSMMESIYGWYGVVPLPEQPRPSNFSELSAMFSAAFYPWLLHNIAVLLLVGIPYVACQIRFGTTPGRWLLGLKIVDYQSGDAPTAKQYILRFFGYIVVVGMFAALFNKKKRALHDYIAGTVVLNMRPYGWYWQKIKQGFRWVRGKLFPARAVEKSVAEPTTEQRHEDGDKPV